MSRSFGACDHDHPGLCEPIMPIVGVKSVSVSYYNDIIFLIANASAGAPFLRALCPRVGFHSLSAPVHPPVSTLTLIVLGISFGRTDQQEVR